MDILVALKQEESTLRQKLNGILGAITALSGRQGGTTVAAAISHPGSGRRSMSAALRARLSQKAKERWARIKAGKSTVPKRTMSAAVRAKIAKKAKERWARVRAEKAKGKKN